MANIPDNIFKNKWLVPTEAEKVKCSFLKEAVSQPSLALTPGKIYVFNDTTKKMIEDRTLVWGRPHVTMTGIKELNTIDIETPGRETPWQSYKTFFEKKGVTHAYFSCDRYSFIERPSYIKSTETVNYDVLNDNYMFLGFYKTLLLNTILGDKTKLIPGTKLRSWWKPCFFRGMKMEKVAINNSTTNAWATNVFQYQEKLGFSSGDNLEAQRVEKQNIESKLGQFMCQMED